MTSHAHIPVNVDEITPQVLSQVLGITVLSVSSEIIGEDRGFTGAIARLCLQGGRRLPDTLIAKLPMAPRAVDSSWVQRQTSSPDAARSRYRHAVHEVSFYRTLAPVLGEAVPKAYALQDDETSRRLMLLLEDVPASRPGDVLEGCSAEQAMVTLQAIAPLHRQCWGRPTASWISTRTQSAADSQERFQQRTGPFLKRYGDRLSPDMLSLIHRLHSSLASAMTALDDAPRTVLHNDLHLDNVLFDAGEHRPAVVLDWQNIAYGPVVRDLVEAVAGSLAVQEAHDHEAALLDEWYGSLPERIRSDYPRSRLEDDYRRALLRKLAGVVGWLATADTMSVSSREAALIDAAISDGRIIGALRRNDAARVLDVE